MPFKNRHILLAQRLLLLLALYSFCRLLFYIFNFSYFSNVPAATLMKLFFAGLRFDATAIVISNVVFIAMHFYPFRQFYHRTYQGLLRILFLVVNSAAVMVNFIDIEFIRFEGKRATTDAFRVMGFGDDFVNTAPRMVLDYWYVLLLFIMVVIGLNKLYKRIPVTTTKLPRGFILATPAGRFILGSVMVGLVFIGFRGGIQYRPINIMTASQYASGKEVSLLLNTPFTILKTLGKQVLPEIRYFPADEAQRIAPVIHRPRPEQPFRAQNVVLIIVESLGKEYYGSLNHRAGYTPFLDSLMKSSRVFSNAFANGKRSIEGIPCVVAGIPALMDEPFITSAYNGNKLTSLASTLQKKGYHSLFFHGGTNGTMGFDNFSSSAGYDAYYGRREYNNDSDFDGNWGIYDEPFLQYTIRTLNGTSQPFLGTIFTISSHHPYKIPDTLKERFAAGTLPIHQSIRYADYALEKFFESARKTRWYDSTLFVITGDHTAISEYPFFQSHVGMYAVPILFYHPHDSLSGESPIATEQIDIIPGVLDYLHYDLPYFAFGNSMFDPTAEHAAINYINGIYQLIQGEYALTMDTSRVMGFYHFTSDSTLRSNLRDIIPEIQHEMERSLKARIQNYNQALLNNSMSVQ